MEALADIEALLLLLILLWHGVTENARIQSMELKDTNFRKCAPFKKRVAIALWKLATGSEYRSIGHLFGVSISSVCRCVQDFCTAAEALLVPEQIRFPNQEKFAEMSAYYENRRRRHDGHRGLTEGAEGTSTTQFIERLLTTELSLPAESDLQIQRAHRSLMPRPASDKPPRSIVVNFLQYTTKEMVLKEAWKKRIQFQDRALFFDHDYATEILQKRKEYITIKKSLKRERNPLPDTLI
ncbi:Protein ANTAGONIST OF LIKE HETEROCHROMATIN PROTEIN 1 [Dissostichus eleginoides]|uniref:Protein ANTAGONIST OF LIKE HETEROCHROMATIN PROTEIN 1 n=1 Tax=Dissostichus eleginoides TaxID=100907 RepID=A0AAD9B3Q5_DISEL|nr:Protein ANTAGONIST OF LIKE HETEROCHROMATIN PROTEIN 1 [Dissostichus eleginoides]